MKMKRQISFSESDIQIRISEPKRPVSFSESDIDVLRLSEKFIVKPQEKQKPNPWYWTAHQWGLRFILHLSFVAFFETVFFWQFVSVQEDDALLTLIDTYTQGIWSTCDNLTYMDQQNIRSLFNFFINSSTVQNAETYALTTRSSYNSTLITYSWVYVGVLFILFFSVTSSAIYLKIPVRWSHIFAENFALVFLLGLYELMFFRTVVLNYKSVSVPEIDLKIYNQFEQLC